MRLFHCSENIDNFYKRCKENTSNSNGCKTKMLTFPLRFSLVNRHFEQQGRDIAENRIFIPGSRSSMTFSEFLLAGKHYLVGRRGNWKASTWNGRPVPELCLISNATLDHICNRFGPLLHNCNQPWLAPQQLEIFADKIHNKEAPLDNCWGFVDGTVRPVCRPGHNQRIIYNDHKRIHALKFQSIVAPNGLITNLLDQVEGCRHDSAMLAM